MSDKASVFLRFNLVDEENGKYIKGIMGNHYCGFNPVGLITRAMYGSLSFVVNRKHTRYISLCQQPEKSNTYQTFRRLFDVDYIHRNIAVSEDSAEVIIDKYCKGEITEKNAGYEFFWCDADFGQVIFDVTGSLKGEYTLKYAIVDNLHNLLKTDKQDDNKIMTVQDYMAEYEGMFKEYYDKDSECCSLMTEFLENAKLMTSEEVHNYFNTPISEYLNLKLDFD